jgi:hypothetical protein
LIFDVKVTKDSGDDEKEKYSVTLKAEDVIGISPSSSVTVTIKLESGSEEIRHLFLKRSNYTVRISPSDQKMLFKQKLESHAEDFDLKVVPEENHSQLERTPLAENGQVNEAFVDAPHETETTESETETPMDAE